MSPNRRISAPLFNTLTAVFLVATAAHAEEGASDVNQIGRYTVMKGGVVIDSESKLMWQQDALKRGNLDTARRYCDKLSLAGYRDWRLPMVEEIAMLVDGQQPIQRRKPQFDTKVFPRNKAVRYWAFNPGKGKDMFGEDIGDSYTFNMERRRKEFGGEGFIPYIWCVREAN